MVVNIVEVVKVFLFFVDDGLEEFEADAVSVFAADVEEQVVVENGVVFEVAVEGEDGFDGLLAFDLGGFFGGRLAAQLFDAFGELLGVSHFVDGDELDIGGQFAVVSVVQIIVLVHILVDCVQLHGAGLVEDFDDFLPSGFFCVLCHIFFSCIVFFFLCSRITLSFYCNSGGSDFQ